jgi:hypothetical protein
MKGENMVYRASDGSLRYEGPPWSELSDEDRTKRIKECNALEFCSAKRLAEILKAFTPLQRPNVKAIRLHIEKAGIVHPKLTSAPPAPTRMRPLVTRLGAPTLGGAELQAKIRKQTEHGKAVVAKADRESSPQESYWETLKRQAGFCVAITNAKDISGNYTGEYCGEDTGSPDIPLCEGHRPDKLGRSKPDLRGRIWMKLTTPASE